MEKNTSSLTHLTPLPAREGHGGGSTSMKKTYLTPETALVCCCDTQPLCGSVTSQSMDISYGGVDEDGTVVAGVRRYDAWEGDPQFRDDSWAK